MPNQQNEHDRELIDSLRALKWVSLKADSQGNFVVSIQSLISDEEIHLYGRWLSELTRLGWVNVIYCSDEGFVTGVITNKGLAVRKQLKCLTNVSIGPGIFC